MYHVAGWLYAYDSVAYLPHGTGPSLRLYYYHLVWWWQLLPVRHMYRATGLYRHAITARLIVRDDPDPSPVCTVVDGCDGPSHHYTHTTTTAAIHAALCSVWPDCTMATTGVTRVPWP